MNGFFEYKIMKVDSNGNEEFYWEGYNKNLFGFEANCIPTLVCVRSFSIDTIWTNMWDEYYDDLNVKGTTGPKEYYLAEFTPNNAGAVQECGGCGNDHYYFAFTLGTSPCTPSSTNICWVPGRDDSPLLNNALISKLKNHK